MSGFLWPNDKSGDQKARACLTSPQTIQDGIWTKVLLDKISFDPSGIVDLINHRIKPKKPGYYQVATQNGISFGLLTLTITILTAIARNGTWVTIGTNTSQTVHDLQTLTTHLSDIIYLNGTTDFIEAFVYQATGAPRNIQIIEDLTNYMTVMGPF